MQHVILQLGIVRGIDLPKADMLSEIDPYVKAFAPCSQREASGGTAKAGSGCSTTHIDDEPNPEWDESFFLPVEVNEEGWMQGFVRLELWDKETIQDKLCGYSLLELNMWPADFPGGGCCTQLTLPVEYVGPRKAVHQKQNRNSRIVVKLVGVIKAPEELLLQLGPTAVSSTGSAAGETAVYLPMDQPTRMYCGIEYKTNAVNILVCLCEPVETVHIDMSYHGDDVERSPMVVRRQHKSGREIVPGVRCYEEAVMTGLPLHVDFAHLIVSVEDRRAREYINVEELLEGYEWPGSSARYEAAQEAMQGSGALVDQYGMYIVLDDEATTNGSRLSTRTSLSRALGRVKQSPTSKAPKALLMLDYGEAPDSMRLIPRVPLAKANSSCLPKTPGLGPPQMHLCTILPVEGQTYEWWHPEALLLETLSTSHKNPETILFGKCQVYKSVQLSNAQVPPHQAIQLLLESCLVTYELSNYQGISIRSLLNPRGEAPQSSGGSVAKKILPEVPVEIVKLLSDIATTKASKASSAITGSINKRFGFMKGLVKGHKLIKSKGQGGIPEINPPKKQFLPAGNDASSPNCGEGSLKGVSSEVSSNGMLSRNPSSASRAADIVLKYSLKKQ